MTTIKEIAKIAGVSRGTVDRVLNHRSGVKKETRERVEALIQELNYQPNPIGKALAKSSQNLDIGVILVPMQHQYIQILIEGIKNKEKELSHYGVNVTICLPKTLNPREQLAFLEDFHQKGIKSIVLFPLNDVRLINYANFLVSEGVNLITLNSFLPELKSICFIGQDSYQGGRTVAELFQKIMIGGKIGVIYSSLLMACHVDRLRGFKDKLAESEGYTIVNELPNEDMPDLAYAATLQLLEQNPDLNAIYLTGGGIKGVIKAIDETCHSKKIRIICHDLTPTSASLLEQDKVDFVIDQDPFRQGSLAISAMKKYCIDGLLPEKELMDNPIIICTKETIRTGKHNLNSNFAHEMCSRTLKTQ